MDEMREKSGKEQQGEIEKIDLIEFLRSFQYGIKKMWWLVLVLALIFGLNSYIKARKNYTPVYTASATVAVTTIDGSPAYQNNASAQQMADVFPYILTSGVLKDVVAKDMKLDSVPGSISVKAEEGTNMLTISVSGTNAELSYKTLKSVIKNYPEVAQFVLGNTTLKILDETGVPDDTTKQGVISSSWKRGVLKGAIIGLVILSLYVLTRRTVKTGKEIKTHLNLVDLGTLPEVHVKKRNKESFYNSVNVLNKRIPQGYLEAFRKVGIKVMKQMEEEEFKTLLVTSSVPEEGKTAFSVNLAIIEAKLGKNVILVDCDMRRPSVAKAMNQEGEFPGLQAVLQGKVKISEAMTTVELEKCPGSLQILYGKTTEGSSSDLLESKQMERLISILKKKADLVIFDTAPSEMLADAPVLARYLDAAVYVIRYDYAKMRQIRMGVENISMSGIHMLGYVLNRDRSTGGGYGYGYGYGYYGRYRYGRYGRYGGYRHYSRYEKQFDEPEEETGAVNQKEVFTETKEN